MCQHQLVEEGRRKGETGKKVIRLARILLNTQLRTKVALILINGLK